MLGNTFNFTKVDSFEFSNCWKHDPGILQKLMFVHFANLEP